MSSHFLGSLTKGPAGGRKLVNVTRGIVLATNIEAAFDSATRKKGLLGRSSLPSDSALIIAPSNAVHMFGMKFAIDVLFARRSGEVVKRVISLERRRIAIAWRAFAAIELAANHPGVAATSVGDQLAIE
jgi:uncharacterized protein